MWGTIRLKLYTINQNIRKKVRTAKSVPSSYIDIKDVIIKE